MMQIPSFDVNYLDGFGPELAVYFVVLLCLSDGQGFTEKFKQTLHMGNGQSFTEIH